MATIVMEFTEGDLGPHMRGLTDRQRAFVFSLVETGGNYSQAAKAAGYGADCATEDKRASACRARGHQLAHDPKVLAAIKEEAQKRLNSGALIAASALLEIVEDPKHKSRLKAIEMLLDRSGLIVKQESTLNVNVSTTDAGNIARIRELSAKLGLDPKQLLGHAGVTVDADFTVIETAPVAPVDEWACVPGEG